MKCSRCTLFITLVLSMLFSIALAGERLPSDPRIETGRLDNGVTWMYRAHDNPPGKMALMIHVDAGSLNETEAQRGLAHFMEHMMFNGTENFPPGELIPYFESIGMEFGADVNAFTSFDQTVYMLFTPDTETEQIDRALLALSDYAFRALLLEEEIDKERGVILAEHRAGQSATQRVRDQIWPRLFEGTRFGKRMPIGLVEVIESAPRFEFVDFYRTWYRPENITVMMVGDAEKERMLPLIEKRFGEYRASHPARDPAGPEFKPFEKQQAIVVTDKEVTACEIEMLNLIPGRPPVTSPKLYRAGLVERIGGLMMNRRFEDLVNKGEASFLSAGAGVFSFFKEVRLANGSAEGEPENWEKMLDELVTEVSRAREHGFSEKEYELALKKIRAQAERAVRTEPTRNANALIMGMNGAVSSGDTLLSAEQELKLIEALLPSISLGEVSAAFTVNFEPGTFAYVLTLPEKEGFDVPGEDDVLAAARAALARRTEVLAEKEGADEILPDLPIPGKVVEKAFDEDLEITSARLSNGALVHHRFMDYKKDAVFVSIGLAGGRIEEKAENVGLTQAASIAFMQPATSRLSSTEITDLMTGKNMRVGPMPSTDAMTLVAMGSPKDLEAGLQLTHALLTDGRIEEAAFENWKTMNRQQIAYYSKMPEYRARVAMLGATSNEDHRLLPLTLEGLDKVTLSKAQAWFERLCATAPLEVAVVGEISWEDAKPLVEQYIASLPARGKSPSRLDPMRQIMRAAGPWESRVDVETITPKSMVFFGFLSCDRLKVREVRALKIASNILSSRLIKRIREEKGLVYSIDAQHLVFDAYQDYALFMTGAPCEPGKTEEVVKEAGTLFKEFSENGPTEEELDNAKKQTLNNVELQMKEPQYWWMVLSHLDLHKIKLDDQKRAMEEYESFTVDQVREVFQSYHKPDRMFTVVAEGAAVKEESTPR